MQLHGYQRHVLGRLSDFLGNLSRAHVPLLKRLQEGDEEVGKYLQGFDYVKEAWQATAAHQTRHAAYHPVMNTAGMAIPDVYFKVPTGGGKTLLACHAVNLIQKEYIKSITGRNTGLVLWLVPSKEIYRQTLSRLKDRNHPYRETLEQATNGRMLVKERWERFTPQEVKENLVVLVLMLPAANVSSIESRKFYRNNSKYRKFFPGSGDDEAQQAMQGDGVDLDTTSPAGKMPGSRAVIIKSLANVIRLCRPVVIIDEGQKAYSAQARSTIIGLNPSMILQLSATPPPQSNIIAAVSGNDLNEAGMIKLDINLYNRPEHKWQTLIPDAMKKQKELETAAQDLRERSRRHIRPIVLVQVERTGKDQRGKGKIHAEDVREHLITQHGIPEAQIAIKSAERDEIRNVDLMSEACPIRYIITRQALQEGWDCSFAYVLVILANMTSKVAVTQLVGRVLRQPDSWKCAAEHDLLNECYVFSHRGDSAEVINIIRNELDSNGMGDIKHKVHSMGIQQREKVTRKAEYREEFRKYRGQLFMPQFIAREPGKEVRPLDYDHDILAKINWDKITHPATAELSDDGSETEAVRIGLDKNRVSIMACSSIDTGIDHVALTRQLLDVIPNPWVGHRIVTGFMETLKTRHDSKLIKANEEMLLNHLKKHLVDLIDLQAESIFKRDLRKGKLGLVLFGGVGHWRIPNELTITGYEELKRSPGVPMQKSLFNYSSDETYNEFERTVAVFLDSNKKLLWWYRNHVVGRKDYAIQGWRRQKVYPDFIFSRVDGIEQNHMGRVFIVESKGTHLWGNEDTKYKKSLLEYCQGICNSNGSPRLEIEENVTKAAASYNFGMFEQANWEQALNSMLRPDDETA